MTCGRRFVGIKRSCSGQAPVLAALLFLLLVPTTIILAENASDNITGDMVANLSPPAPNLSQETLVINISPMIEELAPPNSSAEGLANHTNETNPEPVPHTNETKSTPANVTIDSPSNKTNTSIPTEEPANIILPVIIPDRANLTVTLNLPERAHRSESFIVAATVTNSDDQDASNVELSWILPNGFSIAVGDKKSRFDISVGEEKTFELKLISPLEQELGIHEISARVVAE